MEHTGQPDVYDILRLLQTVPMDVACLVVRPECFMLCYYNVVVLVCLVQLELFLNFYCTAEKRHHVYIVYIF